VKHDLYIKKWTQNFNDLVETTAEGQWPSTPKLLGAHFHDPAYAETSPFPILNPSLTPAERLHIALLVLHVRAKERLLHCIEGDRAFVESMKTIRGQALMVGEDMDKPRVNLRARLPPMAMLEHRESALSSAFRDIPSSAKKEHLLTSTTVASLVHPGDVGSR
jgi:hypothetical protein